MNDASTDKPQEEAGWVLLSISRHILGLWHREVAGIIPPSAMRTQTVPTSPDTQIEHQGEWLPVYTLDENLQAAATKQQPYAIVLNSSPNVALFADNVLNLPTRESLKLQELPACMRDERSPVTHVAEFEKSEVVLISEAEKLAAGLLPSSPEREIT